MFCSESKSIFCTRVTDRKTVAQGFLIETSDKYIALIDKGQAHVIPIKERELLPPED